MMFDLQSVLTEILGSARALVDREVRSMEAAVLRLERAERDRALGKWPEGCRWRELADDDFIRLKTALDLLEMGTITDDGSGRKVLLVGPDGPIQAVAALDQQKSMV